jgi:CheY-like chemotaxis protein
MHLVDDDGFRALARASGGLGTRGGGRHPRRRAGAGRGATAAPAALVDVHLPDTTGFALARRLTGDDRCVRIVLTASDPTLAGAAAAADCGAVSFVPTDELAVSDLATWLDRRSLG